MAKRVFTSNGRTVSCRCVNEVKRTIPGLAMTPSQVAEMAARGIPVSTQSAPDMYDEVQNPSNFEVEPLFKRGADINQIWELSQDARDKFVQARKRDIQHNGY